MAARSNLARRHEGEVAPKYTLALVLAAYRESQVQRQHLHRKAEAASATLEGIASSLRRLLSDREFVALLKSEELGIPSRLVSRSKKAPP